MHGVGPDSGVGHYKTEVVCLNKGKGGGEVENGVSVATQTYLRVDEQVSYGRGVGPSETMVTSVSKGSRVCKNLKL